MAITLISEPEKFMPAYNPIEYVFNSTNKSRCDFRYIMDIYIDGVYVTRLKAHPAGSNDYGTFRIERIIRDYLTYNMERNLVGFAAAADSIVSVSVEVLERYNAYYATDCLGNAVDSAVLYTSSDIYVWNGALGYQSFPGYTVSDYVPTDTSSNFLTAMPFKLPVRDESFYNLHFLQDGSGSPVTSDVDALEINTYTSNGTFIGTYEISNTVTNLNTVGNRHCIVGVGPASLNAATLSSGSQPVISPSVGVYTVQLNDSGGNPITASKTFVVDRSCTKYKTFTIWWLNRLGGFDTYTFTLNHQKQIGISRTRYDKLLDADYAAGDRINTVMSVEAQESYSLTSNWMPESQGIWLAELYTSPEVYMEFTEPRTYEITGAAYNSGFVEFVLSGVTETLPTGTSFSYTVVDGSAIGMSNYGTGFITGYSGSAYQTTVPATVNAGALIVGSMTVETPSFVPIVVTSTQFQEKRKQGSRNINYNIDVVPSYKINIQRQ